jgi:hypothetical protein
MSIKLKIRAADNGFVRAFLRMFPVGHPAYGPVGNSVSTGWGHRVHALPEGALHAGRHSFQLASEPGKCLRRAVIAVKQADWCADVAHVIDSEGRDRTWRPEGRAWLDRDQWIDDLGREFTPLLIWTVCDN